MSYARQSATSSRSTRNITVFRTGGDTLEAAADVFDDMFNSTTKKDLEKTIAQGKYEYQLFAQGWDRIEKRLDLGSARSDSQQNNYRTSHISNPHHLTIVTLQNSSGYHPDVRHVHFAEQGKNAPLPPAPRLPLRMVRLYRL